MKNKNLFNNKIAKGLVSLITIIVLLSSILATSIFYQNNISGFVVSETIVSDEGASIQIKIVNDVKELNQLNEGFYQISNGYVYYLEHFDSYSPLYVKVKNLEQQNGLILVEEDGKILFDETFEGFVEEKVEEKSEESTQNQITGQVTGLESVSGFVTTEECFSYDGRDKLRVCPGSDKAHIKVTTRDDGIKIKEFYDGENEDPIKTEWAPKGSNKFEEETPPPEPPSPPSAPQAPSAPAPDPEKVPIGKPTLANDENYYYKYKDGSLKRWDTDKKIWEDVEYTYYVSVRDPNGVIRTLQIEATTVANAKKQVPKGFTITTDPKKSTEETTRPTGEFKVEDISGTPIVTNGVQSYFIPPGKTAEEYAKELSDKAKINDAYESWRRKNNLPDNKEIRELFEKRPPSDVNRDLIRETLGLTPAEKEKEKKEKLPYERIPLPDGTYVFIYNKKKYFGDNSGNPPQDLQGILSFKKDHLTAVLQEGFTTAEGRNVYLEKNKYIDETGIDVTEATKKEKIGTKEYEIAYTFEKAKKTPSKIKIDSEEVEINDNVLRQLKSNVGKDDVLDINEYKNIVIHKTSTTKEGKEGIESYREITTKTTLTYAHDGLSTSESTIETKDKDGNIITLTKTIQKYQYDKVREQDVPEETIKRIYTKKEGEKSIDESTTDYTEVTTNSLTGEPLQLKLRVESQEFTATYHPQTNKVEGEEGHEKAINQLSSLRTQYKYQRIFANVERIFTEFQGLAYLPTLFMDKDDLLIWRERVDKVFATLYLGTEYWTSEICAQNLDGTDIGIAYAETPQGLAQVGAHIEATRTEPIETPEGRQFIYKITFNVRNGDYSKDPRAPEEMVVNVELRGESTADVFKKDQIIKRGSSFGRTGRNTIVQDSKTIFNEVCIIFKGDIPLRWRLDGKKLCNKIQVSSGLPSKIEAPTSPTTAPGAAPDSEINDF